MATSRLLPLENLDEVEIKWVMRAFFVSSVAVPRCFDFWPVQPSMRIDDEVAPVDNYRSVAASLRTLQSAEYLFWF